MAYQVITSTTATGLTAAIYTASLNGWLVLGGVASSGSSFIQAMVRQDSLTPSTTNESFHSLNSAFTSSAKGPWAFGFPSGSAGIPGI